MQHKILVIDSDANSAKQVQHILEAEDYEVNVSVTGQGGIARAQMQRPGLILLDTDLADIDGYEVCRALRAIPSTAKTPILIYSAKDDVAIKVAGFKAGANDYIVKPVAPALLIARIGAALGSMEQPSAHIVALWGSKGGVGTTTVASNLAVALRSKAEKRVTLVDASVLGGTLGVTLNLPPRRTMSDLLAHLDNLDSELLASILTQHSSGVRVLLSAPWSTNGDSAHPQELQRILRWLQDASDYIVIDTAPSLDESTTAVLQLADQIMMLVTPEMPSLRNARVFFGAAQAWGLGPDKLVTVLNRDLMPGGVKLGDVEKSLRRKVDIRIPNDEALVTFSVNRGIPLVTSHQRSAVARGYERLANLVIAKHSASEAAATTGPRRLLQRRG